MLLICACPAQAEAADDPLTLRRLSGREIAALDALGHVCLYLLQDGQCTIIDDSWYIFGNYQVGRDFPALQTAGLGSLEQAAAHCLQLDGGVLLLPAHGTTIRYDPHIFGDESGPGTVCVIPGDAAHTLRCSDADHGGCALAQAPLNVTPPPAPDRHTFR